jgi:type III pantothenate kinase
MPGDTLQALQGSPVPLPLIAVDIGNTRIKLAQFPLAPAEGLPAPERRLALPAIDWQSAELEAWAPVAGQWLVSSVHRAAIERLVAWLAERRPQAAVKVLAYRDLPLKIDLEQPELAGLDRLAAAVGANCLRTAGRAAVVLDVGTAIKASLLDEQGVFRGGAILPGLAMSARAMHEFTDRLPLIPYEELAEPPPAVGRSTVPAMRSGLFWGAVGAMKELAAQLAAGHAPPEVFLTGGAGPGVAQLLGTDARYVSHLTLGGIAASHQSAAAGS